DVPIAFYTGCSSVDTVGHNANTTVDAIVRAGHRHTGIGLHTPADVHYGHAATVSQQRSAALAAARATHPERFSTTADPKILALPTHAWINQPTAAEPVAA
ncbi:hypothetical protein ABZT28_56895, partial [Streptomyces sp. NPDC005388]